MNRNSNAALWIALAVVGGLVMMGIVVGGVGFIGYRLIDNQNKHDDRAARTSTSSTYTYSSPSYLSPTTTWAPTTTTQETVLYGGIAYSGSGAYQTNNAFTDGYAAKSEAVAQCNSSIWSKGWDSQSHCGWVPLQTGQCGSVATATVASGWGPTGWASGASSRSSVRQAAKEKCDSVGQGICHELITFCM